MYLYRLSCGAPSKRSAGKYSSPTATQATGESELLVEILNQDFIHRGRGVTVLWIGSHNSVIFYLLKEGFPKVDCVKAECHLLKSFVLNLLDRCLFACPLLSKEDCRKLSKSLSDTKGFSAMFGNLLNFWTTHTQHIQQNKGQTWCQLFSSLTFFSPSIFLVANFGNRQDKLLSQNRHCVVWNEP